MFDRNKVEFELSFIIDFTEYDIDGIVEYMHENHYNSVDDMDYDKFYAMLDDFCIAGE